MRDLLLLCCLVAAITQNTVAQTSMILSGTYTGSIAGTASQLTLERRGDAFSGSIDAGGYTYTLNGATTKDTGVGTLVDVQTGAAMPFEIAEHNGILIVTIVAADPNTGQAQRIPLEFRRGQPTGGLAGSAAGSAASGASAVPGHGGSTASGPGGSAAGDGNAVASGQFGERDPALVGSWSYSDTYISGDFSATTRLYMQVNPDGTYLYGSGNVSAGLDNALGSVYGNSGGGDVTRGQWRTQNGVVYVMEAGSAQWVPYARYYVEGSSMMFTFGNGERQVWHRR